MKQGQGGFGFERLVFFTLGHENVNLPRLHGKERLVDGIDLKEDQGLRRFARLLIVVSDELDPAAQVFPEGEPDRPHAILERQFEKVDVLGPRFLELPPEKTGADGQRTCGLTEGRPCDVKLVPEFLDPCVGWGSGGAIYSSSSSPHCAGKGHCLTWRQESEATGERNFAGKGTSARIGHWSEHNRSLDA
jgi:hypothetical protein